MITARRIICSAFVVYAASLCIALIFNYSWITSQPPSEPQNRQPIERQISSTQPQQPIQQAEDLLNIITTSGNLTQPVFSNFTETPGAGNDSDSQPTLFDVLSGCPGICATLREAEVSCAALNANQCEVQLCTQNDSDGLFGQFLSSRQLGFQRGTFMCANKPTVTPTPSPSISPSPSASAIASVSVSSAPTPSTTASAGASVSPSPSQSRGMGDGGGIEPPTPAPAPPSSTATATATPSATISISPSPSTATPQTPSASATPSLSVSASQSPSVSASPSPSASVSVSPSASASQSPSASASQSPSASASQSASASPSQSASASPSMTASPSASPSQALRCAVDTSVRRRFVRFRCRCPDPLGRSGRLDVNADDDARKACLVACVESNSEVVEECEVGAAERETRRFRDYNRLIRDASSSGPIASCCETTCGGSFSVVDSREFNC